MIIIITYGCYTKSIEIKRSFFTMSDTSLLKEMGERIYNRRKLLKYTQEELAEMVGVSTQMISNLELGKKAIRPENLIKICTALNISADYILMGNTSNNLLDSISGKIAELSTEDLEFINKMIDYIKNK